MGSTLPILTSFEKKAAVTSEFLDSIKSLSPADQKEHIKEMVVKVAKGVLHADSVDLDAPLMEAGMDSLSAVEFRNRLLQQLPGVKLPNTVMFDYPTLNAIAGFVASQFIAGAAVATAGPTASLVASTDSLAIVG